MQIELHLDAKTIERLKEQSSLLLRTFRIEFAKDPTSPATKSSRSNVIAWCHTIKQVYGEADSSVVANPIELAAHLPPQENKPALPWQSACRYPSGQSKFPIQGE